MLISNIIIISSYLPEKSVAEAGVNNHAGSTKPLALSSILCLGWTLI
jgi:hypothetical protein